MLTCNFPAQVLLQMRREVSKAADASNSVEEVRNAAAFVKAVDDLRFAHEDLTACPCWYAAVNE